MLKLPDDKNIAIEDRVMGVFTNLTSSEDDYTVWLGDETNGAGRFFLHIGNAASHTFTNEDKNNLIAYYHSLYIRITGNVSEGSFARLIDLHGRIVGNYRLESGNNNSIPMHGIRNGLYLLTIVDGKYKNTTKLVIN